MAGGSLDSAFDHGSLRCFAARWLCLCTTHLSGRRSPAGTISDGTRLVCRFGARPLPDSLGHPAYPSRLQRRCADLGQRRTHRFHLAQRHSCRLSGLERRSLARISALPSHHRRRAGGTRTANSFGNSSFPFTGARATFTRIGDSPRCGTAETDHALLRQRHARAAFRSRCSIPSLGFASRRIRWLRPADPALPRASTGRRHADPELSPARPRSQPTAARIRHYDILRYGTPRMDGSQFRFSYRTVASL